MTSTRYIAALKLSLLASLGILPLACGGTTSDGPDGNQGGSGGSATSGGSNSTAGTITSGGAATKCTSPTTDPLTGLVTCKEGYQHRPTARACGVSTNALPLPAGGASGKPYPPDADPIPRADGSVNCADDATKCSQYLYGYCETGTDVGFGQVPVCRSGCYTDQDCGSGYICQCGSSQSPTTGVCVSSTCLTDANCADGYRCASYSGVCGPGGFACQTPDDQCMVDADCADEGGGTCTYESISGVRACTGGVACGRPFLIEDCARVAPVIARRDWALSANPRVDHLAPAERAALAAHWTRLGQLEHASIAAFARFSLQLLSLGAPAELVQQCTAALADETAHTKLCFGLASAYAGRAIGPGPLDIERSLEVSSLADIVDLVIAEGCFGETGAALEALAAADSAADPLIRAAYGQIASDEQRHAELAFRFVRWALTHSPEMVAGRIATAIARPAAPDDATRQVALPCLQALLDTQPSGANARPLNDLPAV